MTDRPPPEITPKAQAERAARLNRESAALRDNLRKRKAQIRARIVSNGDPELPVDAAKPD